MSSMSFAGQKRHNVFSSEDIAADELAEIEYTKDFRTTFFIKIECTKGFQ